MSLLPFSGPPLPAILPISRGGTGSATQNFVDLTTLQSVAGQKTFTTRMFITASLASGAQFAVTDTSTPSSSSGAGIVGVLNTDPSASGQRLGFYFLGSPIANSAGISGFSTEAHSSGHAGTQLRFETTPIASASRAAQAWIDDTGFYPQTNNTKLLGGSSNYWSQIYGSRLYLNSTAYLDGGTAGVAYLQANQLKVAGIGTSTLTAADNGYVSDGSGLIVYQSSGFALSEIAGAWQSDFSVGIMGIRKGLTANPSGNKAYGTYSYVYVNNISNSSGVAIGVNGKVEAWTASGTAPQWGSLIGVQAEVQGGVDTPYNTNPPTNVIGFNVLWNSSYTNAVNTYGFYGTAVPLGTNRYGMYLENVTGGTTNYAIYTNAGRVRFGDYLTVSSTNSNAFAVGPSSITNPVFNVDASTASVATGLNIKGAAAAAGLALSVISSGTNENMTIDAKGSGTITFGSVSTGNINFDQAAVFTKSTLPANGMVQVTSGALSPGGTFASFLTPARTSVGETNLVVGVDNTNTNNAAYFGFLYHSSGDAINNKAVIGLTNTGDVLTVNGSGYINTFGNIYPADATNIVLGTTTGTKIGTATSQKLSFWNKTPIIQPTTGIAAATFVANTSGTLNDTATWGGYTIGQVVQALQNIGILT